MFGVFLQLQLKRAARHLPLLLAGAMLLFALTGSIAFLSSQKLYGDAITDSLDLAVVYSSDSQADRIFINALADQETLEGMTQFKEMPEEEARQALAKGEVVGIMKLPQDFVNGIITGKNTPATILLNENRALESKLLQTLTTAGAKTLSASQGALYAAWDEYTKQGIPTDAKNQMNQAINNKYLPLALGRDQVFKSEVIQATGQLDPLIYFLAAWMVLFLLLMGMLEAFIMRPLSPGLISKLEIEGIGPKSRTLTDWIKLILIQVLLLGLLTIAWMYLAPRLKMSQDFLGGPLVNLLAVALAAGGFILFIYVASQDLLSGMLTLFALSFVLIFLSGGFIPTSFLPGAVRALQPWLPTTWWIQSMGDFFTGVLDWTKVGLTAASGLGFYVLAALWESLRRRGGGRA